MLNFFVIVCHGIVFILYANNFFIDTVMREFCKKDNADLFSFLADSVHLYLFIFNDNVVL